MRAERRTRPVDRQIEIWRRVLQLRTPERQLSRELRALQRRALPECVIRILQRQLRQHRWLARQRGVVQCRQLAAQYAERPAVGNDVMHDDRQHLIVVGNRQHHHLQQWTATQIETQQLQTGFQAHFPVRVQAAGQICGQYVHRHVERLRRSPAAVLHRSRRNVCAAPHDARPAHPPPPAAQPDPARRADGRSTPGCRPDCPAAGDPETTSAAAPARAVRAHAIQMPAASGAAGDAMRVAGKLAAIPAGVGVMNRVFSGNSICRASRIRAISCVASSECPPSAKKSSCAADPVAARARWRTTRTAALRVATAGTSAAPPA